MLSKFNKFASNVFKMAILYINAVIPLYNILVKITNNISYKLLVIYYDNCYL
jgi:hypothetical protein